MAKARTLLLHGQGMLNDPKAPADSEAVLGQIERLGFVQLDSINIVERAHHHILWTRMHAYRPGVLDRLQRDRKVFEHWTHDASIIPAPWFPRWRRRFARVAWGSWLRRKMGKHRDAVLEHVMERIRREGPLSARDFEHQGRKGGAWWDWKPAKTALEYLWQTGELAIPHRVRFEKVYDLTARVLPEVHGLPAPESKENVDWACRGALERLGVASAKEIAGYWGLATQSEAAAWCAAAVKRGEIVAAQCPGDPPSRKAFAPVDWKTRVEHTNEAPRGMRLLSPFDPLIRDRARCLRLFGFDYRFEAFVPAAKRKFGYYVMPIMEGTRIVGRLDPRLDRDAGLLRVREVWWEAKPTAGRRRALGKALEQYCTFSGATGVEVESWGGK